MLRKVCSWISNRTANRVSVSVMLGNWLQTNLHHSAQNMPATSSIRAHYSSHVCSPAGSATLVSRPRLQIANMMITTLGVRQSYIADAPASEEARGLTPLRIQELRSQAALRTQ